MALSFAWRTQLAVRLIGKTADGLRRVIAKRDSRNRVYYVDQVKGGRISRKRYDMERRRDQYGRLASWSDLRGSLASNELADMLRNLYGLPRGAHNWDSLVRDSGDRARELLA